MIRNVVPVPQMISSRMTVFHKRVFPVLWLGMLGVMATIVILTAPAQHRSANLFALIPLSIMAVVGVTLFRKVVFDLVDEVWDEGSALLIKNGGREVRVELTAIMNINYAWMGRPPRVTLSLRQETALGKEISFLPPSQFLPFSRSPIVAELIERVDAARQKAWR